MTFKTPDELIVEIRKAARKVFAAEANQRGIYQLMFIRPRGFRRLYYRDVIRFEPWTTFTQDFWIDRRGRFYESSELWWHPTTQVFAGFSWKSVDRQMDADRAESCGRRMIDLRTFPHAKLEELLEKLTEILFKEQAHA